MFANYAAWDDLDAAYQTQESETISWSEVEQIILVLDGKTHTYLMMSPSSESAAEFCFGIRAAGPGMYVCNFYNGDEYYLINPNGSAFAQPLHIGEFVFYSSSEFTTLEDTLRASKTYFENGIMDSTLTWEEV